MKAQQHLAHGSFLKQNLYKRLPCQHMTLRVPTGRCLAWPGGRTVEHGALKPSFLVLPVLLEARTWQDSQLIPVLRVLPLRAPCPRKPLGLRQTAGSGRVGV